MRLLRPEEREKIAGMYLSTIRFYLLRFEGLLGVEDGEGVLVKRCVEELVTGLSSYDPDAGESLDRFVRRKIVEGIVSGVRRLIPDLDSSLALSRDLIRAFGSLTERQGRPPTVKELAEALCWDEEGVKKVMRVAVLSLSTDGTGEFSTNIFAPARTREELARKIESLDADSRLVVALHHFEEFSFQEIASILNREEDEVVTLYSRAMLTLLTGS
ncbi:MAG: hypothetical protein D6713_00800 [Deltaproteobacteria bacterium]|nr:MAG: hypothetical protein D6713_00800 [Deltaproteobacteria bacterium]